MAPVLFAAFLFGLRSKDKNGLLKSITDSRSKVTVSGAIARSAS